MRKVTEQVMSAFINGESKTVSNTTTDGSRVGLFGKLIAYKDDLGTVYFSLAGWNTVTTRDRLNGLIHLMCVEGGKISCKQGVAYRDGEELDNNKWYEV